MMSQPVYFAQPLVYPQEFDPARPVSQPVTWSRPAQVQAAPAAVDSSPRPAPAARQVIRAKGAEEPSPSQLPANVDAATALTIPSPEELGILPAPSAETNRLDWAQVHRDLERLATITYRLDKLPQGGCRFTCLLATSHPGLSHRVEAEAASEAEAVRLALDKAKEWSAGKQREDFE
jgi:hypothetical protein